MDTQFELATKKTSFALCVAVGVKKRISDNRSLFLDAGYENSNISNSGLISAPYVRWDLCFNFALIIGLLTFILTPKVARELVEFCSFSNTPYQYRTNPLWKSAILASVCFLNAGLVFVYEQSKILMIRNYCKVIFQNIIRNKTYSLINILGLSVGLAVCIIILQYVRFEKSYDRFHAQSDQLYRVILEYTTSGGIKERDAANFAPVANALMNDYPEVTGFVRITPEYSKVVFNHDGKISEEAKVYYADSTFFTLFDFKLLQGDPKTALTDVGSVVLSQTAAEKYFGRMDEWKESPLNKTVLMNNREPLKITGIMKDIPVNSHFKANALISFTTFIKFSDPSKEWGWNDFYTYIKLAPGTDYKQFEAKLPAFVTKYKGESKDKMIVQPLTDIHLHSNVGFELSANGSSQIVYFLSIISGIILIVAWVNYVNLATARAGHRAKEIGVRKVNGATRSELVAQFLLESFFMNFIGLLLAMGIVSAVMPMVSHLLEKPLAFPAWNDKMFLLYTSVIYVGGSLASRVYPAIILSSFKPVKIFKPSSFLAKGNSGLRQALVIFQFMISAALITGTLIIENQMEFIRHKDLGYNYDKTIVMSASSTQKNDSLFFQNFQLLKENVLRYPEVEKVTTSSVLPGKSHNDIDMHGGLRMVGDNDKVSHSANTFRIDEDFIDVFEMKLIAGKNFSGRHVNGDEKLILNRKAAEVFGFNNPQDIVGKKIHYWGKEKEVVGVIENYHHKSLKNNFEPIILRYNVSDMLYITMLLQDNDNSKLESIITRLKKSWNEVYPDDPFVYFFLEDHVNEQYKADNQFSMIFSIFSGFSIFIACLGLFGLVSYAVSVRIKEIGVRKVLGASIGSIVLLFSKAYFKLLVIAFLIGLPLAHYILNLWIDNFAYKADISLIIFIIPIAIVTLLSWLAVCVEILKAAVMNPVNSLRHE